MRGFVRRSIGCLLLVGVPLVLAGCKDGLAPSGSVQVFLAPTDPGVQAFVAAVVAAEAGVVSLEDVESIDVSITQVEIQRGDDPEGAGPWVSLSLESAQSIDLLSLPPEGTQIAGGTVGEGTFGMIRLFFDDATISLQDGVTVDVGGMSLSHEDNPHPLFIPSGAETGIKIPTPGFEVESGAESVTIQFDAALSVQTIDATANGFLMNPVLTAQAGG